MSARYPSGSRFWASAPSAAVKGPTAAFTRDAFAWTLVSQAEGAPAAGTACRTTPARVKAIAFVLVFMSSPCSTEVARPFRPFDLHVHLDEDFAARPRPELSLHERLVRAGDGLLEVEARLRRPRDDDARVLDLPAVLQAEARVRGVRRLRPERAGAAQREERAAGACDAR